MQGIQRSILPLQVDCAWYKEDLHEVAENPTETLKAAMKARCALQHGTADSSGNKIVQDDIQLFGRGVGELESACPECFDAQRCANTLENCFNVHEAYCLQYSLWVCIWQATLVCSDSTKVR